MSASPPERLLVRIRAAFLEMPDVRLKPEQVQRLCGVERTICQLVLESLVDAKFLCVSPDGHYAPQATDRDIARRAHDLYLARGRGHGHDVDDWLQAERALRKTLASSAA
jgi:Protein of unknown function (DUF2934)